MKCDCNLGEVLISGKCSLEKIRVGDTWVIQFPNKEIYMNEKIVQKLRIVAVKLVQRYWPSLGLQSHSNVGFNMQTDPMVYLNFIWILLLSTYTGNVNTESKVGGSNWEIL